MKELTHNRHRIIINDNIAELPIIRFQAFNRWLMLESGIGSDINAINAKLSNIAAFIERDKKENALKEVANMSQALAFMMGNISPEQNAFICLCEKIDGKQVIDYSDEGVEALSKKINDIPIGILRGWIDEAKKKLKTMWIYSSRN